MIISEEEYNRLKLIEKAVWNILNDSCLEVINDAELLTIDPDLSATDLAILDEMLPEEEPQHVQP